MALGLGPKPPEDPKRDAAAKPPAEPNIPAAPPAVAPPAVAPPAAAPPPKIQPAPQPQPSAPAPQSQPSTPAPPKPEARLSPALEEIAAKHDKREAGAAATRPSAAPRRRTAIGFTVAL